MDTMRVRVAKGHRIYHEGRDHTEGESIFVPQKQAKILIKLGRAVDASHEQPLRVAEPRPATGVQTRDLLSEGEQQPAPQRRGRYRRTDMRSED